MSASPILLRRADFHVGIPEIRSLLLTHPEDLTEARIATIITTLGAHNVLTLQRTYMGGSSALTLVPGMGGHFYEPGPALEAAILDLRDCWGRDLAIQMAAEFAASQNP